MSFAETAGLGALAGFTIYLGLPAGRIQLLGRRSRVGLAMFSMGVLAFIFLDVMSNGLDIVHTAMEATEDLDGASVEVIDLRSLVPLDEETILASVRKTSKVLIVDEANETCAAGAQVAALIADKGFEDLDGPVRRIATPDVPIPFSPPLEQAVLPSVDRVKEAARELLEY